MEPTSSNLDIFSLEFDDSIISDFECKNFTDCGDENTNSNKINDSDCSDCSDCNCDCDDCTF